MSRTMTMNVPSTSPKVARWPRLRQHTKVWVTHVNDKNIAKMAEEQVEVFQDLEHSMRHFVMFGKLIGIYPSKMLWVGRIIIAVLTVVTIVDWVGLFTEPTSKKRYRTAAEICGRVGSGQFYTIGTFCYIYLQTCHQKLVKFYEKWSAMPVIREDKHLTRFVSLVSGAIMTSAILENISFHFKLFPVFEPPVQNMTSFEVYYARSHNYWAKLIPFTPYQAVILIITNKLALYAWNYSDILATVLCRALRHRFDTLNENIDTLGPAYAVKRYEDLIELMRLLENFLSPLVFACFYQDFYATCMQLHMWMTPDEHKHILHTIYLLWAFIHLLVRVFLLSYQASRLHESSISLALIKLPMISSKTTCSDKVEKQISRIDFSPKRELAISGLGCFFITKRFVLKLFYVAFSFQIFLMQSESLKCN